MAALIGSQFASYERLPVLEVARADRRTSAKLDHFLAQEEAHRKALAAEALADLEAPPRAVAALAAQLDIGVWRALVSAGFTTAEAAAQVTEMMQAWLEQSRVLPPPAA
jgi:hypothetical protein